MNRKQFVNALSAHYGGDKAQAAHALDAVQHVLTATLARGEKISFLGFGAFDRRVLKARWVRNPRTGEQIQAQATAIPRFRPGVQLKAIVSGKRAVPPAPAAQPPVKKAVAAKKAGPTKKAGPSKNAGPTKAEPAKKANPSKKADPPKKANPTKKPGKLKKSRD